MTSPQGLWPEEFVTFIVTTEARRVRKDLGGLGSSREEATMTQVLQGWKREKWGVGRALIGNGEGR